MPAELTPQQLKALDFRHSISLKANAGSGKTFVLAKRYLEIALVGNIPLHKIAAITFTDKAAGELYKRIAEEIEFRKKDHIETTIKLKLEKIRRQLVSANISTIHSFCISILKEFPVDAALDANFTPIDQTTASELQELSIEETLREKLENSSNQEIKYLIRLCGSKINLAKQLRLLINHRKIVLKLNEEVYYNNIDEISKFFEEVFGKYFRTIYLPMIGELTKNLTVINNAANKIDPKNKFVPSVADYINKLERINEPETIVNLTRQFIGRICTKNNKLRRRGYLSTDLSEEYTNEIYITEEILNEFSKIHLDENTDKTNRQLAITGKYLINLFEDIQFSYDHKKKELGYLDYEDILIKTRSLLQSKDTLNYLSEKFSYLMVDEYQDTNEIQYEIFMPLLDYLKKGNLFVVGDDKQSIYRFRDAELEVFERTNVDIANKHGNEYLLSLPDSFRMEPAICLFTNELFRNLFHNPDNLYNEVGYSELVCAKPVSAGGKVSLILAKEGSEITEAELISKQILNLIKGKNSRFEWKDIAVLVRKRSSFKLLEKHCIRFNIPYQIIGGRGFFQRQSIYDIFNYFSFLLNTQNDAALVGILRSPFFLLSDVDLYEISENYGKSFWEKMLNSSSISDRISSAIDRLQKDIDLAAGTDINTLMRDIFENTNFIAVLASRPDGDQELANIEKLKRITNNFSSQGFKTIYDYVNYLNDAIRKLEDEGQAGLASQSNAVNILTLHQAKGLEFPVVFLYKCNEVLQRDLVKSKSIIVDKNLGLLTKVPLDGNYFEDYKSAPVLAVRDYIEYRKSFAEAKRLFYVGVTRAKDRLFVSATSKENQEFNTSSFMGMVSSIFKFYESDKELLVEGELNYLEKDNSNYKNVSKHQSIRVPIIQDVELSEIKNIEIPQHDLSKKYLLENIEDKVKGEIISATKVAAYSQCPFKYNLIYKYGYTELYSEFQHYKSPGSSGNYSGSFGKEDFDDIEVSVIKSKTNIKGKIIHKALQFKIEREKLEKFIRNEISSFNLKLFNKEEDQEAFVKNVMSLLTNFYNSEQYKYLSDFPVAENEFQIYLEENSHFLFGILDKIIMSGKRYIIVDYKTDDIKADSIEERSNDYFNQLNFYVYIVSKLYQRFEEIETRLIFLKYPDNPIIKKHNRESIKETGKEIQSIIKGILNENFSKELSHCRECNFSLNNKCIV